MEGNSSLRFRAWRESLEASNCYMKRSEGELGAAPYTGGECDDDTLRASALLARSRKWEIYRRMKTTPLEADVCAPFETTAT